MNKITNCKFPLDKVCITHQPSVLRVRELQLQVEGSIYVYAYILIKDSHALFDLTKYCDCVEVCFWHSSPAYITCLVVVQCGKDYIANYDK